MLCKCRRDKNTVLADKFTEQFNNKSDKEFWRNIKNKINSKVNLPTIFVFDLFNIQMHIV